MNIIASLENKNKPILVITGFLLIAIVGFADYLTGSELKFSAFYVLPISLIIWVTNKWFGYIASMASAAVWFFADSATGFSYSNPLIFVWNALILLIYFCMITFLLSSLKSSLHREKEMSRTDYLTSVANTRHFYEIVQIEIDRFQRYQHPFTIVYFDLDNFKTINDQFGHKRGDLVLQTIASSVRKKTRNTDLVARLGGDEFAIFFPETDQENAQILFTNIHNTLLEEMQRHNWSITFSIGVLTCRVAPATTDELIKKVDDLMYSVKSDGKNSVKYFTYVG